ncbi:hypothetical protein KAR26_02380 [Candidatus Parcubacteria bacterium]|nr:hypothetical protein [Candidatus Parcubacteria bacterium]
MNKKKIIISVLVILLFVVLGIAGKLYYSWQLEEYAKWHRYVPSNEFIIEETESKKIIKHKGTRLTMEILIDWQIEKEEESFLFTSPDFQLYPETINYNFPIFEKGCAVAMYVSKEKKVGVYEMEYNDLQNQINWYLESPEEYNEFYSDKIHHDDKIIEVNGSYAVKHAYSPKENHPEDESILPGEYIAVKIPKNKYIYIFETYLFSEDKERCEQEFDKFLETVVIE